MKKISVLMPTYNDSDTICESIDSIFMQTYSNWELIIIDDGSTDQTKEIINRYKMEKDKENKIKYIYQQNSDQLLAIVNGLNYAIGDYIYILHSDDLLNEKDTFMKASDYMMNHSNVDGIIGNLTIIDADGNFVKTEKILPYFISKKIPVLQLLWLGRNLYTDMGFYKKNIFETNVYNNYLVWNKPFWLNTEEKVSMLNIKNSNFSLFKYRVYQKNYANNELGKLCLINGELRTAIQLMKFYDIPFYNIQYLFYRLLYHLSLFRLYKPIYYNRETKNKAKIINFIIKKRYHEGYKNNAFFNSLVNFYQNKNDREINFDKIYDNDPIYYGNGFRIFNKQLLNNTLPKLYINMFEEMQKGFNTIAVSEKNKDKAINLSKFLCLYPFVEIRCNEDEKR